MHLENYYFSISIRKTKQDKNMSLLLPSRVNNILLQSLFRVNQKKIYMYVRGKETDFMKM